LRLPLQYKYLANLDGPVGSSKMLPLLHSGSVVVAQQTSPFVEWYFQSLKPGTLTENQLHVVLAFSLGGRAHTQ